MALPIALRGSDGIRMINGPPSLKTEPPFERETSTTCKVMAFSKDGSVFGWCNGQSVKIVDTKSMKQVQDIARPKVSCIGFSPNGTLVALWEPYAVDKQTNAGVPNLHIHDVATGACLKSFIQKKAQFWIPQWTDDEQVCARNVNNELHFYENNNFDTMKNKLQMQKIAGYSLSSAGPPYMLAGFVPGAKGQPSFVRVYKYPNFGGPNAAVANRTFFKSDDVKMMWNKIGTAVLVLTTTETSESSYYGDTGLHYLGANGEASLVHLGKNGPVYHIEWSPRGTEFCVVYGFMPAKATLYNCKTEPVFDFGTGPRNFGFFNPQGNNLLTDLQHADGYTRLDEPIWAVENGVFLHHYEGNMEFWDLHKKKLISQPQAADTTSFQWSADGEHVLTATTAPRLRVGNGYRIWHYTGALLEEELIEKGQSLYEVFWQPAPDGQYPEKPITYRMVQSSIEAPIPSHKQEVYVPPSLRGKQRTDLKLNEYEPPSNLKQDPNKPVSKSKKKRDAKKAKAVNNPTQAETRPESAAASNQSAPPVNLTGDQEKDKEIRKIRKKLQQIEKIKEQQKAGKQLELNQTEKLKQEDALLQELEDLQLG